MLARQMVGGRRFFLSQIWQCRKKKRGKVFAIVVASHPELLAFFEETLELLQDVQRRRNAVSHGLWLSIEEVNRYPVQPLRYDKANTIFEPIIIVDLEFLNNLLDDMSTFSQRIYWVGAELLAHQQLKKRGKR
jgi:hypothetical protein